MTRPKALKGTDRLIWAVETLAVRPTDRLLEVGCGQGVAVSLVCDQLTSGSVTAIDQSAKMIALAEARNRGHVAAGKASFRVAPLAEAEFGEARFDKVFAIRIGVFVRGDPARELEVIRHHLEPGGGFYLIYDPARPEETPELIRASSARLESNGFRVSRVLTRDLSRATVFCIVARGR